MILDSTSNFFKKISHKYFAISNNVVHLQSQSQTTRTGNKKFLIKEVILKKQLLNKIESQIRGSSSFGRARPCQGRGGRFEPGLPLSRKSPGVYNIRTFFMPLYLVISSPYLLPCNNMPLH